MGDMTEWARNEVRIACQRENPDRKDGEFDYGCSCYESALKAFESLMEDGHSGMSISLTKQILVRLIDGKPLTPIEDTPDMWNPVYEGFGVEKGMTYQHKRLSSLFKDVMEDGTVRYDDVNRVRVSVKGSRTLWSNGLASRLVNEMYPITFPYTPDEKPYILECTELLTDRKNGDYDTIWYKTIHKPNGTWDPVNRYFKYAEVGMQEVDKNEFIARWILHLKRKDRERKAKEAEWREEHGNTHA